MTPEWLIPSLAEAQADDAECAPHRPQECRDTGCRCREWSL